MTSAQTGATAPARLVERRRGYSWQRRTALAGTVAAVGIAVALLAMPDTLRARMRSMIRTPPDRASLLSLLSELKAAWNPADRDKVVEHAREHGSRLDQAFHWVLAQPTHAYVVQAIDLAGELRIEVVRADLLQLTSIPSLRGPAYAAADRIEPLSSSELSELFESRDKDLLLTAVKIAARRDARPVAELLGALRQPDQEVCTAVLSALPPRLPAEFAPVVAGLAADPQVEIAAAGMRALAHLPFTAATESLLVDALTRPEQQVREAAGAALSQKGEPLAPETRRQLWSLIAEATVGHDTLALAFLSLERTNSVDVEEVLRRSSDLDPFGRYFAARLLASKGRQEGVQQLFDLLADVGPDEPQVRFASLSLLAGIAHLHVGVGVEELRAWFLQHPLTGPQSLPAPPLDW